MIFTQAFEDNVANCYDIRSKNLDLENARILGQAFGTVLFKKNKSSVCIGYDRRMMSEALCESFIDGLLSTGVNVFFLGECGTPIVQYMAFVENLDAAVSVTASHNALEYHGFKFFVGGIAFAGVDLVHLIKLGRKGECMNHLTGRRMSLQCQSYFEGLQGIKIQGKFKVGWDLVHGSGGNVLEVLKMSKSNIILNANKTKDFGGFPPDPGCVERLNEILELAKSGSIDLGFIIDGDADRLVVVVGGKIILGDVLLSMFCYLESLIRGTHVKVVWDDISSLVLKEWVSSFCDVFITKTGHSYIQNLVIQKKCFMGGELSGHYMFQDWGYIDDGIYAGLKLLHYLEYLNLSIPKVLEKIPSVSRKKFQNLLCENSVDQKRLMLLIKKYLQTHNIQFSEFDGIRVFLHQCSLSIRASNTECVIRFIAETLEETNFSVADDLVASLRCLV